jgi:DNA replication protein DnaC
MERLSNIMRAAQESSRLAAQQRALQQPPAQGQRSPARRPLPEQNGHLGAPVRSSGLYRSRSALPLRISETRQENWEESGYPRSGRAPSGSQRPFSSPQTVRHTAEFLAGSYCAERERATALSADVREEWNDDTAGMRYGDWENEPGSPSSDSLVEEDREPWEAQSAACPPVQDIRQASQRMAQPYSRDTSLATRDLQRAGAQQTSLPVRSEERETRLPQIAHTGPRLLQRTTQPLKPQHMDHVPGDMQMQRRRPENGQQHRQAEPLPENGADYTITVNSMPTLCPLCKGAGFLRNNVPFGHPQFGKAIACECKEQERKRKRRQYLQEISNLGAFASKRFETFNAQAPGTLEAFQYAQRFAQNPNGWLLLVGPTGCGKTHLAAAIANHCLETGAVVLFATVPDLLDHLRAAFAPDSSEVYDQMFGRMREAEVLVLDDLGVQQSSPWANEKLFQLFNYRYNSGFPTVVTTNPRGLYATDERIRSRLGDVALVNTLNLDRARDHRPHNRY